jgi:hypothetical protein
MPLAGPVCSIDGLGLLQVAVPRLGRMLSAAVTLPNAAFISKQIVGSPLASVQASNGCLTLTGAVRFPSERLLYPFLSTF